MKILKTILKNIGQFLFWTCLLVALALVCNLLNGCDEQRHRQHYTKKTHQHVKVYKQHKHHALGGGTVSEDGDWIYWYILDYNDTYYYYSSPTYYSPAQYPTFQWSTSKANPIAEEEQNNEINEVADQEISNAELGGQLEQTIDTTEQQMNDMVNEGNPNTGDTDTSSGGNDNSGGSGGDTSGSGGSDGGSSGGDGGGSGGE